PLDGVPISNHRDCRASLQSMACNEGGLTRWDYHMKPVFRYRLLIPLLRTIGVSKDEAASVRLRGYDRGPRLPRLSRRAMARSPTCAARPPLLNESRNALQPTKYVRRGAPSPRRERGCRRSRWG